MLEVTRPYEVNDCPDFVHLTDYLNFILFYYYNIVNYIIIIIIIQ